MSYLGFLSVTEGFEQNTTDMAPRFLSPEAHAGPRVSYTLHYACTSVH